MKQKTVVITGASSGIGMEFARAFSKMGCRLILTARRKERLEKLREELVTPCKIIVLLTMHVLELAESLMKLI